MPDRPGRTIGVPAWLDDSGASSVVAAVERVLGEVADGGELWPLGHEGSVSSEPAAWSRRSDLDDVECFEIEVEQPGDHHQRGDRASTRRTWSTLQPCRVPYEDPPRIEVRSRGRRRLSLGEGEWRFQRAARAHGGGRHHRRRHLSR